MKIIGALSDRAILEALGQRITERRLALQLTQAALAEQAGVSKRTVERIEAGATSQLITLVRILRTLDLADNLNALIPHVGPSPIDLLKLKGHRRQRASSPRKVEEPASPWIWADNP
jgi:transcriptional regulator with XRE-family HTH domain